MLQPAIHFFKRNPAAKSCHVVLDQVFEKATEANTYRNAVRAYKVSSFTRKEYDAWKKSLKETEAESLKDKITVAKKNEKEAGL